VGRTYVHAVASLDGYIADEHDDVGPLHDWYFSGDHPLVDDDHPEVHGAPFRVSGASADYVRDTWSRGQALALGLIDHLAIDVVPVVFGRGKPYFGPLADGHLMLADPDVVIPGDGVLHLRFPVRRAAVT
jgi:hypothetical protein